MSEFFRHFRPLEVTRRGELVPSRNGGVSFLCVQKENSAIDFWVHSCPMDAGFSAKAAVKRLRDSQFSAAPWGTFTPDGSPLLLQLSEMISKSELPTTLGMLMKEIVLINLKAVEKHSALKPESVIDIYAAD